MRHQRVLLAVLLAGCGGEPEKVPARDASAPDTFLIGVPPPVGESTAAVFTFLSSEPGGGFRCSLDGGEPVACASPLAIQGLAVGAHGFSVAAEDAAGNMDPTPAGYAWTIVAPFQPEPPQIDTFITAGPSDPSTAAAATFWFAATLGGATFSCRLDEDPEEACTSPRTYKVGEGEHLFRVAAADAEGRTDPTPATHAWTVVAVEPAPVETFLTYGPPDPSPSPSATFWFTASDPSASFACSLDGATPEACASPKIHEALGEGPHAFEVTAAGDATPAAYTWTVDTLPPATSVTPLEGMVTSLGALYSTTGLPVFAFASTEPDSTFACKSGVNPGSSGVFVPLDDVHFALCDTPWSPPDALSDGSYLLVVFARDRAGNADPYPRAVGWTVDTKPPETTVGSGPAGLTKSRIASVYMGTTEFGSIACSLDGGAWYTCVLLIYAGYGANVYFDGLSDGDHHLEVAAVDRAGNTDLTPATRSWTVDGTPPDTTLEEAPPPLTGSTTATFRFSASDGGSEFKCRLIQQCTDPPCPDLTESCASPKTYAGLSGGGWKVSIWAVDAAGNEDLSPIEVEWTVDTARPETTLADHPAPLTRLASATFSFSANEAVAFACALDDGPAEPCTSSKTYDALSDGPHTFAVTATDAASNVELEPASWSWTVDTLAPQAPGSLTVAPGDRSFTTSWAGVEGASGYKVYFDTDSTDPPFAGSAGPFSESPATLADLEPCTTYFVTVTALDDAGNESGFGAIASAAVVMAAPASVSAMGGAGQIAVTWSAVPGADEYYLYYGPTETYGGTNALNGPSPRPVGSGTSFTLRGLAPHVPQHIALTSFDGPCESAKSAAAISDPYPWRWVSPSPTGNSLASIDCLDADRCVAVGELGTVLRTTDGGASWVPGNGGAADFQQVQMIDANVGYALSGNTLFQTTDGAARWTEAGVVSSAGNAIRSFLLDGQRGWAVGDFGTIRRTSDGGESWESLASETTGNLYAIHMVDAQTGYAVGQTILKTTNGGATWAYSICADCIGNLRSVWCLSADRCWAAGGEASLKEGEGCAFVADTSDGGQTWTPTVSFGNGVLCDGIALHSVRFANDMVGWAVGSRGTILGTADGGANWSVQTGGETGNILGLSVQDAGTALVVGAGGAIRKTTDGGATWVSQQTRLAAVDLNEVRFADSDRGTIAGGAGLILHTGDGGSSWTVADSQASGNALNDLFFADAATGFAVGEGGTIVATADGGASWAAQQSGVSSPLVSVQCIDSQTCWSAGPSGVIRRTEDGGASWTLVSPPAAVPGPVWFFSLNQGVAGAPGWYTLDGGANWAPADAGAGADGTGKALFFKDPAHGWAAGCAYDGAGGFVIASSNGGASWPGNSPEYFDLRGCLMGFKYVSDSELYVVGGGGAMGKSAGSWRALPSATRRELRSIDKQPGGRVWIAGVSGTVLASDTGGQ